MINIVLTEQGRQKAVDFIESHTKDSAIYWNTLAELCDDVEHSLNFNEQVNKAVYIQIHYNQTKDGKRHRLDFNSIDDYTREVIL